MTAPDPGCAIDLDLLALRIEVSGREAARRLYGEVLGGEAHELPGDELAFLLPGGVVAASEASGRPGPREIVFASDDPSAVGELLGREQLTFERDEDELVLTAPTVAGGQVRIVGRDHALAEAARPGVSPDDDVRGSARVVSLDHVCLAVTDVGEGARVYSDVLGGRIVLGGDSPWGARALQVRYDRGKLELLAPLDPSGPVGGFLQRRGQRAGVHHLTLLVADAEHAARACEEAGFGTVDTDTSAATWHETFIRPRPAFGMLIQLAWTDQSYHDPLPSTVLEDVLAGHYEASSHVMRRRGGQP